MQTLVEDIRFGCRSFLRTPGLCVLIVITLALGIGVNTAIFSMVHNVLLAPLPFAQGEQLVKLETHHPNIDRFDVPVSVPTAMDYIEQNQSLSHLVEYHQMPFTLLGYGDAANVEAGVVSWDFFEMLGVKPLLGRTFLPGEDGVGARPLIVLSHRFWLEKFGGADDVIGLTLQMNDASHQVIGVLPPLPAYPFGNDIWIGSSSCPGRGSEAYINGRNLTISSLYGKLNSGVDLSSATVEFNALSQKIQAEHPEIYPQSKGLGNTLTPMRVDMAGDAKATFYLLLGITALVLLIACANVVNLNLARMTRRKQELAIRKALGANPRRIARQVLTESILLALAGGILGLLVAYFCMDLLADFAALYTPLASEIEINSSVLVFCVLVSLGCGILSGVASIFDKDDINEALKQGSGNITLGQKGSRLRQTLLIAQFSLSFVILTCASLVSLSLYRLNVQDTGFDTADIVAVDLSSSAVNRSRFVLDVVGRLSEKPEIAGVAFASEIPLLKGRDRRRHIEIEGRQNLDEHPALEALKNEVSANFHSMLHIPLLQGRYFTDADDSDSPAVTLINQAFAERYFFNDTVIGQRISIDGGKRWLSIVGVVGDIREVGVNIAPVPTFYVPWIESWHYDLQLLVDSKVKPDEAISIVRDVIRQMDSRQAVAQTAAFEVIKSRSYATSRLTGVLVSGFASLAFVIALSGLVGVVAHNVGRRRKEIGIRVAMGANPARIRRLFLHQGLILCGIGLLLGAVIMTFISPFLHHLLFATDPLDFKLYIAVALVVALAAVGAVVLPVSQATNIQPGDSLREL